MFVFCDNPLFCNRYENRSSFGITNQTCFCVGLVLFCRKYGNGLYFDIIKICFFCFLK